MANRQDFGNRADALRLDSIVARVRGEYFEMPGLQLTCAQACRLWHMDPGACETVLERLVQDGFLCKTDKGAYIAATTVRRRT